MIDSNSGAGFLLFHNIAEARVIKRSGGWAGGWGVSEWVGLGVPEDVWGLVHVGFGFRGSGFRV